MMDTSKIYIEMCDKADEIQEEWSPKLGDWCISPQGVVELVTKSAIQVDTLQSQSKPEYLTIQIGTTFGKGGEMQSSQPDWKGHKSLRRYIFLPRQDQLQEIVWQSSGLESYITYQKPLDLLAWLYEFAYDGYSQKPQIQSLLREEGSLEQLWLALAMKGCYKKVWSIEKYEWVKPIEEKIISR